MYVIALNLTQDIENVSLENMADVNVGCLHDYTLKTSDLIKLENADIFIINGLGVENFLVIVTNNNKNIKIIEASKNLKNLIKDEEETNAHVWMDIDNYIAQVKEVANNLKEINPDNSSIYEKNEKKYLASLNRLKLGIEDGKEEDIISFSETLQYLEKPMNINILTVESDHEQNSLSAEKLKEIVEYAKEKNVKKVFVDNISSTKNAETLAKEVGAKVYVLNSFLNGEYRKDAYEIMWKENLKVMGE